MFPAIKKKWPLLPLIAITLLSLLSSCQKVIDVKLNDADKKLVIDAVLTDQEGGCVVKLSKTKSFNDDNVFAGFSGAVVTIKDDNGNTVTLNETATGVYTNATLKGVYGKTYQLSVTAEDKVYNAVSTMPQQVAFDSLYLETQYFFDEDETFAHVVFQDPAGVKNFYLFKQFVNGKKAEGNFVVDDDLSDGKKFRPTLYLFTSRDEKIKTGDEVVVEMQCIDQAIYKYWFSYDQGASGSGGSATPANPVSNISGGALGYFSAQTVQRKTIIAP